MNVASLQAENEQLRSALAQQMSRVQQLEEMIRALRQKQFGRSTETTSALQIPLFNELEEDEELDQAAETEEVSIRGHQRKRRGRPRISDDLPRVDVIHDLDEADRFCHTHGCSLTPMGEEISEQLEFIPAKVQVLRHICRKYTCPECEGNVITAKKPPQPIPKSMATASLLAWIVVSKYMDALPLYRQCEIFKRIGFTADRTTLANWMIACGQLVQPLINLLWDQLRAQPVIHMDETTVQVLAEAGRKPDAKSYMWVAAAGPPTEQVVLFEYQPSRSGQIAQTLLVDYEGTLMVDGYEGYGPVCTRNGIKRLGCWAHARRGFVEAKRMQPKGTTGRPDQALVMINKLYGIERKLKEVDAQTRYVARQELAVPVLAQLREWLDKTLPQTAPKTALGKALYYLNAQWQRLIGYIEDGRYPIDNNRAENAIRPFVIGRKNWLFSQSVRGAKASANLYSLIETAKASGLEPMAYLMTVFTELPKAQTIEDISALLPSNIGIGDGH